MYSPKISEDLIPKIYRLAKVKGTRMTTLVNIILEEALNKLESETCIKEPCKGQGRSYTQNEIINKT